MVSVRTSPAGRALTCAALAIALGLACTRTEWRAEMAPVARRAELPADAPFLKAHLLDGGVVVLGDWRFDEARRALTGDGVRYGVDRVLLSRGRHAIPLEQIALLETNRPETVTDTGVVVLALMTGASVALSALCLTNPKACFGSCPTFYASDGRSAVLQAEGFSDSVLRAFERTDVDHMRTARASGPFIVEMRNEALETHAVRSVRVLAVPRTGGRPIFRAADRFWSARSLVAPLVCTAPEGDCRAAVLEADERERASPADERDLAARETIDLVFAPIPGAGPLGLVIGARNTLLNTFLFYQLLAWAGRDAGAWMARLEREAGGARERVLDLGRLLGGITVQLETPAGPSVAGEFFEVGPIAREVQIVPLPAAAEQGELRVQLDLTRGNWKLDWIAVAEIEPAAATIVLEPRLVTRGGRADARALAALADPDRHLVTYPGDRYVLEFAAPPADSELFLESRGYYYEWIRREWLADESALEIARLLIDPGATLRRLAPAYKRVESSTEAVFWRSRIGRKLP